MLRRLRDAGHVPWTTAGEIELAGFGATVVVGDFSPEQLRLNVEKVAEAGLEVAIESRELLGITVFGSHGTSC